MSRSFRPNVIPAKQSGLPTKAERVERSLETHTLKGKPRWAIKDICDFCLKYAYVKRDQLGFRRQGRKFMCDVCRFEGDAPRQEEAVAAKYLPAWQSLGKLIAYFKAKQGKHSPIA